MVVTDPDSAGFTLADLDAMPDDGRRYELIGGSIIVTPPPSVDHQRASFRLQVAVRDALDADHEVLAGPIGLSLPTGDEVEPDLVVVRAGLTGKRIREPVPLVVELLSPGSARHDSVTKLDAYARAGVEHYWLLDTREGRRRFRALRLGGDGEYLVVATSDEQLRVDEPVRLDIPLAGLFSPRPDR